MQLEPDLVLEQRLRLTWRAHGSSVGASAEAQKSILSTVVSTRPGAVRAQCASLACKDRRCFAPGKLNEESELAEV